MADTHGPDILIVTSADFGELANALYLLDGTAVRAHLLIPEHLHQRNRVLASSSVSAFHDPADILSVLHQNRPRALLLMSGYLFGINGLLNISHLGQIVREARGTRVRLATTDPFLNVLSGLSDQTFVHPRRDVLTGHFAAVREILREVIHLYLSPVPGPGRSLSFYNPRFVVASEQRKDLSAQLRSVALRLDEPYWLFVLSLEDYVSQSSIFGRAVFDGMLLRMLGEAVATKRRPVLLAPQVALNSLASHVPQGVSLLEFCDSGTFRALLLLAEYVFYWNVFSNSVLARVANSGPVFFFDAGHLARSIPAIVPVGMQSYYANAVLPMWNPTIQLDAGLLAERARIQPETFAPALAAFRSLPTPEEMLAALCT